MRFLIKLFLFFQFYLSFSIAYCQSASIDSIFHPDSLHRIVEILASDSMKGRFTGTVENFNAALFIADEFRKAGLKHVAGNKGFFQEIKPAWYNVMGAIEGKSKSGQVIIFSAHYDHVGTINTNLYPKVNDRMGRVNDGIYNGANDNASGVAVMISLAKYFKTLNNNERTLVFVAFTGEELGLLGSQYLADNCEPDSIIAMINIDMVGRKNRKHDWPYMTGNYFSNLSSILNSRLYNYDQKTYGKRFIDIDRFSSEDLFRRSDNYPFAKLGVPAHTIMATSPTDPYYHSLGDEAKTLDYEFMSRIIKAIAISCEGLVKGEDTPSRITAVR